MHGSGMSQTTTASKKRPSGHLGRQVMPWLAEEMLVG